MATEISFLKAMLTHTKLEHETLSQFREQMGKLTPADKAWFSAQFATEFGYTITTGAPVAA